MSFGIILGPKHNFWIVSAAFNGARTVTLFVGRSRYFWFIALASWDAIFYAWYKKMYECIQNNNLSTNFELNPQKMSKFSVVQAVLDV